MIAVSAVVQNKARVAGADDWLVGIDGLVDATTRRWSLTVDGVLDGGTEALVLAVTRSDGIPAVLKLCIPRGGGAHAAHEAAVLRLAGGAGCVELYDADVASGALLIERLGPSLCDLGIDVARRRRIMCTAASTMWQPPPPDHSFMTGADKGRWLIDAIIGTWKRLDQPCPEAVIDDAVAAAGRRIMAHDDERSVLVHGDVHQWNTLQTTSEDDFKLIDPDGLIAEPEYDLGVIIREDPVELRSGRARDVSRQLAAWTGCDETAIWEWGVVERVSTGLLCVEVGLQPVGNDMLATAAALVGAD